MKKKKIFCIYHYYTLLIFRKNTINLIIPNFDDSMIAISSAIILFILPSKTNKEPLMKWKDAISIPWGFLLLFEVDYPLAMISSYRFRQLDWGTINFISFSSAFIVILLIVAGVNFLTELTSNMATTAMLLPVMIPLAALMNINPYLLLVGTTLAASCAFIFASCNTSKQLYLDLNC